MNSNLGGHGRTGVHQKTSFLCWHSRCWFWHIRADSGPVSSVLPLTIKWLYSENFERVFRPADANYSSGTKARIAKKLGSKIDFLAFSGSFVETFRDYTKIPRTRFYLRPLPEKHFYRFPRFPEVNFAPVSTRILYRMISELTGPHNSSERQLKLRMNPTKLVFYHGSLFYSLFIYFAKGRVQVESG